MERSPREIFSRIYGILFSRVELPDRVSTRSRLYIRHRLGKGYEFMDQEFQQIVRDAELGKRLADKLVKIWRKNGQLTLVLAHIEVQSQYESGFAQRMFVYNYRICAVRLAKKSRPRG